MARTPRHQASLRPLRRSLFAGLALIAALGVGLFVSACNGGGSGGNVDAAKVISEAVPAMQALKSFHFGYEVQKPQDAKPTPGLEISRIVGDVVSDGKMKAKIDVLQSGLPLTINFVSTGNTHYIQDPTSQKWQSLPAAMSPVGTLNLSSGAIAILQKISNLQYVGTEDVAGTKSYHLRGSVAPAEVAAIAGASSAKEPYAGDIWIGVDDHLVRRIKVVGAAAAAEDPKTVRVIDLSAFNEPVSIEAPK